VRNPTKRFARHVGAGDDYTMDVVFLLGGVTMVFLLFIAL
jgi:hypothetical protein